LPSASRPEFFVDRSLGRHLVPDALRAAGAVVRTMADVYGERIGQGLPDEEWLADAGKRGWVVLMKDARVRYRPAQLDAVSAFRVRTFCLANANLRGSDQARRFVTNLPRITRVADEPGPYIYGVYADSLKRLWPRS
jgi:PIN domain-containing protein